MKKKTIVLIMSLALVACLSIGATLAWLTSQTGVLTNTFTVGKIGLTLDEAQVSNNSVPDTSRRTTTGNSYAIYDSAVLPKDPTVTISADSENCYVFMSCTTSEKMAAVTTLNIDEDSWKAVEGHDGLYVYSENNEPKIISKSDADKKLPALFTTITVADECNIEEITRDDDIIVKALAYQSTDASTYSAAVTEAAAQLL